MLTLSFIARRAFYFVYDNWRYFAVGLAIVLIAYFAFCGRSEPVLDEKSIQESQNEMREREEQRLNESLERSEQKVFEIESNIKTVEQETRESANKVYSNKSTREIGDELKEKLKR